MRLTSCLARLSPLIPAAPMSVKNQDSREESPRSSTTGRMTLLRAQCRAAAPRPRRCCVRLTDLSRKKMFPTGNSRFRVVSMTAWGPASPVVAPCLPRLWTLVLLTPLRVNVIKLRNPRRPLIPTKRQTFTSSECPGRRPRRRLRELSCTRASCCPTGSTPGRWSAVQWWSMALRDHRMSLHYRRCFRIKVSFTAPQSQIDPSIENLINFSLYRTSNPSECQCVLRHQHTTRPQLRAQAAGRHQQGPREGGRVV